MLPLAAAAGAKKRARRFASQWRRFYNRIQIGLNVAAFGFDNPAGDPVSWNCQGHEDGLAVVVTDSPSSMHKRGDVELSDNLSHKNDEWDAFLIRH
jgi:hypothetical protein